MKRETPRQFIMKKNRAAVLFAFAAMMLLLAIIAVPPRRASATFVPPPPPPGTNGKIAFTSDRDGNEEIYTINADGSGQTRLTNNAASDRFPAWSPDGTKIAFDTTRDGGFELYSMNADGTGQTRLTFSGAHEENPDWSPDGLKIAFTSTSGDHEIFVMNADGTAQTNLTQISVFDDGAAWSPDGTKIAFHRNFNTAFFNIWVMNADGTAKMSLTNDETHHDTGPSWSPDGTKIAFTSDRDGNAEIYVMNADGTGQTRITNHAGSDANPAWSPDGTKLAFQSNRSGNYEVYVCDGTAVGCSLPNNISNNPGNDIQPSWGPGSPLCVTPPLGMVSWWPGDGDSNDIQGSNHGSLQNGANFAPGMVGQAFSFDRIDDFVHVPDSPNLSFGDGARDRPFSIDAWVFPETLVVGQAGHNGNWIINKRDNSNNEEWQLGVHDSGRVFLTLLDDSPGNYIGCNAVTGTISTNTWQHIAATYDGSSSEFGIKLYVNGALIPCTPVRNGVYVAMNDGTSPVRIGMNGWNTLYGWDGLLDEIEIFNRALTQSEIAAIYNAGSAGKCKPGCVPPPPNMTSWWDAEGNANDIQGPHDGTLHGNTGFSAGKVGQAFSFDGGGDYVDVGDVDLGAQFTMDAWIKPDSFANAPMIISKPTHAYRWFIRSNSSPSMFLVVINADNGGTQYESIPSHVVGQWQHVAVTYNGIAAPGNRIRFYLNGQPLATGTVHNDDGGTPINDAAAATLGRSLSLGQDFDGLIDELEIFDRALTDAEIAAIYNAGSAGKCKDIDECPDDPNKTEPGTCGCGIPDTDSDNDGTADCNDSCPADPNKINPGLCGCGVADTDSDNDGTPDCNDACPADPNKIAPGACGCGVADTDSDNDGTADCTDQCPNDPNKINPGACGCGFADTDSDGDGAADCLDQCPNDSGKTAPGECGCGVADTDTDHDGIADCRDNCPLVFNPDQRDTNGDGVGDVCTPFQFPEGGQFVIGDGGSLANGATVYFWGSHWAQNNPMSGGPGPNAFKGFENSTGTPICGGTWTSQPGNSSEPPASVPQFMAVIVSNSIQKNGSVISGDIKKIVIVRTNPGYGPNPGHAGTGQVVAIVCEAPTQSASLLNPFLNSREPLNSLPSLLWLSEGGLGSGTFRRYGQ